MAAAATVRIVVLAALIALGACATTPKNPASGLTGGIAPQMIATAKPLQCVPFARDKSGIQLRGDAHRWWEAAAGRYERGGTPRTGAVIVLKGYGTDLRGHVAVVRRIVDARTIVADHANWLNRGEIQLGTPIVDVSAANDWSAVRVWHIPSQQLGQRVYGVDGFIYPSPKDVPVAGLAPVSYSAARAARG